MVTFAGQSTDTTVATHTIESAWLVKVKLIWLPKFLTASSSISNQVALPASIFAPVAQSKVTKSSRKQGLVAALVTSKPK